MIFYQIGVRSDNNILFDFIIFETKITMKEGIIKSLTVRRTCPLGSHKKKLDCPEDVRTHCYLSRLLKINKYILADVQRSPIFEIRNPLKLWYLVISGREFRKRECKLLVNQNGKVGAFLHRFIWKKIRKLREYAHKIRCSIIRLEYELIGKRNLLSC